MVEEAAAQVGEERELAGELAALQEAVTAERTARVALEERLLAAHRRALLAEQCGQVVEELVAGDSVEALDASVERARAAHARIVAAARTAQAATPVPVGNAARMGPRLEGLSPQAKIAAALRGTAR